MNSLRSNLLRSTLVALFAALALPLAENAAPAPSLYDFTQRFTDQDGQHVTLAQLGEGHPVLVTMFYGTCPAACPLLINRIQRIEAKLTPAQRAELRVVLVTFDPARDSVAVLKQLQVAHGVDASRWSFVRTDDAGAVRALAAVLGIKYRFLPNGAINHSSVITSVAPDGVITGRMESLAASDDAVLVPLQQAHAGPLASTR
jgi:protein SCO1/2